MTARKIAGALAVSFGLTAAPATSQESALIEHGRAILQEKCAGCHAAGPTGKSPT